MTKPKKKEDLERPQQFGISPGWQNRPLKMLLEMIKSPYYLPVRPELRALIKQRQADGDHNDYRPSSFTFSVNESNT